MKERFIEIKFYYFIKKLLYTFNNSIYVIDLIETICLLANANATTIKMLVKQAKENSGILPTYKEETVYIARQLGISYGTLQKLTGISIATQYRTNAYLDTHSHLYEGITKHTPDSMFNELVKFMQVVEKLGGILWQN